MSEKSLIRGNEEEFKTIEVDNLSYRLNLSEKTANIEKCEKDQIKDIFIPRSIKWDNQEYIVTRILKESFKFADIRSLSFPPDSEVRTIEKFAFYNSKIQKISIPPSVCELHKKWQHDTFELKEIKVMPGNQYYKSYNDQIVVGKTDPKSDIFDDLIFVSRELTSFTFPPNIKRISPCAFMNCQIEKIIIPSDVVEISECSFANCVNLNTIEFSPDSQLQIIRKKAFYANGITKITIPSHVTQISKKSFYLCVFLRNIKFERNSELKKIEKKAFFSSSIKKITVPSTFSMFEEGWCRGMSDLMKINVIPYNDNYMSLNNGEIVVGKTDNSSENFDDLIFVSKYINTIKIPSNIKRISPYAFEDTFINKILIPSHVTRICKKAFLNCELKVFEVEKNSELRIIENKAFSYCSIESLLIPETVCTLEEDWCQETNNLNKVTIMPNNQIYKNFDENLIIGKSADSKSEEYDNLIFASRNIKNTTLPPNIKYISPHSFARSSIISIIIPPSVKKIGKLAFYDCAQLNHVEISHDSDLQIIEKDAFSSSSIKSFFIPSHILQIDNSAFYRCENLKLIEIDENINQKIEIKSLFGCSSRIIVMIPIKARKHVITR